VKPSDACLVDEEQRRKWAIWMVNLKCDGLAVILLKILEIGKIYQQKFVNLYFVELEHSTPGQRKGKSTHVGEKSDEEVISVEQQVMVITQKDAVTRVIRIVFNLLGNPTMVLDLSPLCPTSVSATVKCVLDLQHAAATS